MSRPSMLIATRLLAIALLVCDATIATADDCHRTLTFAEAPVTSSFIDSATVYGDFNEDGWPDVALMIAFDTRIVALNQRGVFQPMSTEVIPTLSGLRIVGATDVNRDGHVDLIYRTYDRIQVALGLGDGTFRPPVLSTLSRVSVNQWRMIDFNHDGLLDFVDFDFNAGGYTFVQSKGDGTFQQVAHFDFSGGRPQNLSTTAGDFDGDGNIDVFMAATESSSVTSANFALSDGNFHFVLAGLVADIPFDLQPIDLDGDGAEELVAVQDGSLVILRLKARQVTVERIPIAPKGTTLLIANPTMLDADGDGIRDLVFASNGLLGVIPGTGSNHFGEVQYFELRTSNFAAIDLDHDGLPDIAATAGKEALPVLYGATLRAGRPNANRLYPIGFTPLDIAMADIDGDGSRDLVATGATGANGDGSFAAAVLFGDAKGGFPRLSTPLTMPAAYVHGKGIVGDFDGDGHADVAITSNESGPGPIIAFGTSSGFPNATLQIDADTLAGEVFVGSTSPPALIALKGDDVQLVTISSSRSVTSSIIYHRPAGAVVFSIHSDADASAQFAVAASDGLRLITRTSTGWQESVLSTDPGLIYTMSGIASADLNGDGRRDFVVWGSTPLVFFARADGSYQVRNVPVLINRIDSVAPVDFDGDGVPDLVVSGRISFGEPGRVEVFRNVGGNFELYDGAITGAALGVGAAAGDLDGDGLPEVLIPTFRGVEVLNNICGKHVVHVAALPPNPAEGSRVTLVIHPTSVTSQPGQITVSEGGKVLGAADAPSVNFGANTWLSPPLTAGTHTFRIDVNDLYSGPASVDFEVTTKSVVPRRRAARH